MTLQKPAVSTAGSRSSDPRRHDPDNFVYLVHGFQEISEAPYFLERIIDTSKYSSFSLIARLSAYRSMTLFGQEATIEQVGMLGGIGFITR